MSWRGPKTKGIFNKCWPGDGGHAMSCFGYGRGYWIIANSWGPGWGDNGYAYVDNTVASPTSHGCQRDEFNTVILDAHTYTSICPGASQCQNGGSFDNNCGCECNGFWTGRTCTTC